MARLYRFTFSEGIGAEAVEQLVADAIRTAEDLHGPARVRLAAKYHVEGRRLLLDTSTEVGEQVAQLFTGLASRRLGEESFRVERVGDQERVAS